MRGRASLNAEKLGPKYAFRILCSRFLKICKFFWPLVVFARFFGHASLIPWSMAFCGGLYLENERAEVFWNKKNVARMSNMTWLVKLFCTLTIAYKIIRMRARSSFARKKIGPRHNYLNLFLRFLEIYKFVWPLVIFPICTIKFRVVSI